MKVKVTRNSSSPVEVMGLGLLEPNVWVDITPEQEAAFETLHGKTLEESGLEIEKAGPRVRPPVGVTSRTPDEDDNTSDTEGGEE